MTWKQLAAKVGVKHIGGQTEPFFTAAHLERAMGAVLAARKDAGNPSQSAIGGDQ
jgi:hypothetical protein